MESSKITITGAQFEDVAQRPETKHLYMDTVLVDRSSTNGPAVAYQLRGNTSDMEAACDPRHSGSRKNRDLFALLGPVERICNETKRIYLANRTVVNYNRMITYVGPQSHTLSKHPGDAFCFGAFQTILDSARCAEIRTETIPALSRGTTPQKNQVCAKWAPTTSVLTPALQHMESFLDQLPIKQEGALTYCGTLNADNCRFYQVQD